MKEKLTQLLLRVFKPLVRILLRHGISYKASAEVLKWCYVDVAHKEFGINNKKANKSRVAVITGLTWIDVKNLIDNDVATTNLKPEEFHRASRVLSGWASDTSYQENGKPKSLPIYAKNSREGVSFESLVDKYSGGATIRAILDDLLEHKAIEKVNGDNVSLIRSHYISSSSKSEKFAIDIMAESVSDVMNTINHNTQAKDGDLYMQRIVKQADLPVKHVPLVKTFIRERSQKLADEVDSFITTLSQQDVNDKDEKVDRLGLGLYYFQEPENRINSQNSERKI